MTVLEATTVTEMSAKSAWSRRVRRIGGFIQVAFAAFWLIRGGMNVHGGVGVLLVAVFGAGAIAVTAYGIRVTAGKAPRPTSPEGMGLERAITVATAIQLVASFAVPFAVIAAG